LTIGCVVTVMTVTSGGGGAGGAADFERAKSSSAVLAYRA